MGKTKDQDLTDRLVSVIRPGFRPTGIISKPTNEEIEASFKESQRYSFNCQLQLCYDNKPLKKENE